MPKTKRHWMANTIIGQTMAACGKANTRGIAFSFDKREVSCKSCQRWMKRNGLVK